MHFISLLEHIFTRAQTKLRTPTLIKWQITCNLLFMRIFTSVKRQYAHNNLKFRTWSRKCGQLETRVDLNYNGNYGQLPRIHPVWFLYDYLSTCWLVFALCKYMLPQAVGRGVRWMVSLLVAVDGRIPSQCYLPGRIIMLDVVRNEFGVSLALMNLCLRMLPRLFARPYSLPLVDFLLQHSQELDNYYDTIGVTQHGTIPAQLKGHPFNRITCFPVYSNQKFSRFSLACHDRVAYFKLRPNRTRQAHRKLTGSLATATLVAFSIFGSVLALAAPLGTAFFILDKGYLYSYPHCDPSLEQLERVGGVSWLSVSVTRHRLLMYTFDCLDNLILWFDSMLILIYGFMLPCLLDADLRLCWSHLYDRIIVHRKGQQIRARRASRMSRSSHETYDLHELKCQLCDFFVQLRQADLLVSDCISCSICAWVFCVTIISNRCIRYFHDNPRLMYEIGLPDVSFQSFVALGIGLGSIPISCFSVILFQVHSRCRRGYQQLCSLIATNTRATPSALVAFATNVLEYFVHANQTSYRLFQLRAFTATTYLSLIPWTISLLAILSNIVDFRS